MSEARLLGRAGLAPLGPLGRSPTEQDAAGDTQDGPAGQGRDEHEDGDQPPHLSRGFLTVNTAPVAASEITVMRNRINQ